MEGNDTMDDALRRTLMIVIFGRPGAGKSTISGEAVSLLKGSGATKQYQYLHLDLDVCVPQWMRDNFSKGVYPTLQQRASFISDACDYAKGEIRTARQQNRHDNWITLISFSFVNIDLRIAFRNAFPHAQWILVDTDKNLAERRILSREGHFYKASSSQNSGKEVTTKSSSDENNSADDENNSEWEFCPVDFPHIVLDGCAAVETNAKRIVKCIEQQIAQEGRTM